MLCRLVEAVFQEGQEPGGEVDIEADFEHEEDDAEHEEDAYHGAHDLDEYPEGGQHGGGCAAGDEAGIPAAEEAALGGFGGLGEEGKHGKMINE